MNKMFYTFLMAPMAWVMHAAEIKPDAIADKLQGLGGGGEDDLLGGIGDNVASAGNILLLAISILSFLWVTYSAVAKFRECQAGRADWSELLVLGVAAGALLVFVTILLSNAGGILGESVETGTGGQ